MAQVDVAFGAAIRKKRHELGLSQEALAFKAGVHRTYISQLERGIKSPSLNVIFYLAEALEVSMHSLLQETESILKNG